MSGFYFLVLKGLFSHNKISLINVLNLFVYSQLRLHAFLHLNISRKYNRVIGY